VRRHSAQVLANLRVNDKMVVLALAHAAKDDDAQVRQNSLRALQILGTGAKLAAPTLVKTLKETGDGQTRLQILYILQSTPGEAELIVPAVAVLIKDANPGVRSTAIGVLANQGQPAVPHLIATLKDADANVRMSAVWGLQRVPGDLKDALPALID